MDYNKSILEFICTDTKKHINLNIHYRFQQDIKDLYNKIKPISNKTDLQRILDDVTKYFKYTENTKKVPTVARMFPKYYLKYLNIDKAAECTLASALLKLELENKGLKNIKTVILNGHQLVLKENSDNSITFLDPSNRHTDSKGVEHGFYETFKSSEIYNKNYFYDNTNLNRGYIFIIKTSRIIKYTQMFTYFIEKEKKYANIFFASEPNTLIETAIACENLEDLKEKELFPILNKFNSKDAINTLNLFDPKALLIKEIQNAKK